MEKPEFIYFDIDDTLLDHHHAQNTAIDEVYKRIPMLAQVPLDKLKTEFASVNINLWKRYGNGEIDRHFLHKHRFEDTMAFFGLDTSKAPEIADLYMQLYSENWMWIDGAKNALRELNKNYNIGFITNGFSEVQHAKFDRFELFEFSDIFIVSEDVGFLKPHPGIFMHAAKKSGADSSKILYVGDSIHSDIDGGKNAGWQTAWYNYRKISPPNLNGTFIFDDFDSLIKKLT